MALPTGVIPILSAPNVDGSSDGMLAEAIAIAAKKDLVGPTDHVVCLMSIKDSLVLKIVSIDELSGGRLSYKQGGPLPPLYKPAQSPLLPHCCVESPEALRSEWGVCWQGPITTWPGCPQTRAASRRRSPASQTSSSRIWLRPTSQTQHPRRCPPSSSEEGQK